MRKLPNPAAIISGEPITGLSRTLSAGPASASCRMVLGATVLMVANTAEGPSDANTPAAPRQTLSTAASSASTTNTASASAAASPGEAALWAPAATTAPHRSGVRFQTTTWWPFSSARRANASPMFPVPMMAILTPASVPAESSMSSERVSGEETVQERSEPSQSRLCRTRRQRRRRACIRGTPKGTKATMAAASARRAPHAQLNPAGLSRNATTTRTRLTPVRTVRS